jgi:hypothetical protein
LTPFTRTPVVDQHRRHVLVGLDLELGRVLVAHDQAELGHHVVAEDEVAEVAGGRHLLGRRLLALHADRLSGAGVVGLARRRVPVDLPQVRAVGLALRREVGRLLAVVQALDVRAIRAREAEIRGLRGQLHVEVRRALGGITVEPQHHAPLGGHDHVLGHHRLARLAEVVGERVALDGHVGVGRVVQLHPVGGRHLVVEHGERVGGHDLVDDELAVDLGRYHRLVMRVGAGVGDGTATVVVVPGRHEIRAARKATRSHAHDRDQS